MGWGGGVQQCNNMLKVNKIYKKSSQLPLSILTLNNPPDSLFTCKRPYSSPQIGTLSLWLFPPYLRVQSPWRHSTWSTNQLRFSTQFTLLLKHVCRSLEQECKVVLYTDDLFIKNRTLDFANKIITVAHINLILSVSHIHPMPQCPMHRPNLVWYSKK